VASVGGGGWWCCEEKDSCLSSLAAANCQLSKDTPLPSPIPACQPPRGPTTTQNPTQPTCSRATSMSSALPAAPSCAAATVSSRRFASSRTPGLGQARKRWPWPWLTSVRTVRRSCGRAGGGRGGGKGKRRWGRLELESVTCAVLPLAAAGSLQLARRRGRRKEEYAVQHATAAVGVAQALQMPMPSPLHVQSYNQHES